MRGMHFSMARNIGYSFRETSQSINMNAIACVPKIWSVTNQICLHIIIEFILQDDLYAVSWYEHVLPQLKKERWGGKRVREALQGPGEVIYVPHGIGHSVLNLNENLSITENFLALSAIDELAKFHALQWNPMHFEVCTSPKYVHNQEFFFISSVLMLPSGCGST